MYSKGIVNVLKTQVNSRINWAKGFQSQPNIVNINMGDIVVYKQSLGLDFNQAQPFKFSMPNNQLALAALATSEPEARQEVKQQALEPAQAVNGQQLMQQDSFPQKSSMGFGSLHSDYMYQAVKKAYKDQLKIKILADKIAEFKRKNDSELEAISKLHILDPKFQEVRFHLKEQEKTYIYNSNELKRITSEYQLLYKALILELAVLNINLLSAKNKTEWDKVRQESVTLNERLNRCNLTMHKNAMYEYGGIMKAVEAVSTKVLYAHLAGAWQRKSFVNDDDGAKVFAAAMANIIREVKDAPTAAANEKVATASSVLPTNEVGEIFTLSQGVAFSQILKTRDGKIVGASLTAKVPQDKSNQFALVKGIIHQVMLLQEQGNFKDKPIVIKENTKDHKLKYLIAAALLETASLCGSQTWDIKFDSSNGPLVTADSLNLQAHSCGTLAANDFYQSIKEYVEEKKQNNIAVNNNKKILAQFAQPNENKVMNGPAENGHEGLEQRIGADEEDHEQLAGTNYRQ